MFLCLCDSGIMKVCSEELFEYCIKTKTPPSHRCLFHVYKMKDLTNANHEVHITVITNCVSPSDIKQVHQF